MTNPIYRTEGDARPAQRANAKHVDDMITFGWSVLRYTCYSDGRSAPMHHQQFNVHEEVLPVPSFLETEDDE